MYASRGAGAPLGRTSLTREGERVFPATRREVRSLSRPLPLARSLSLLLPVRVFTRQVRLSTISLLSLPPQSPSGGLHLVGEFHLPEGGPPPPFCLLHFSSTEHLVGT